jgi:hypothetical protein
VKDPIQSVASLVLGGAVVVLAGWLTADQISRTHVHAEWTEAGADAAATAVATPDAGSGAAAATATGGATAANANLAALDSTGDGGFSLSGLSGLLDAGAMPTGAPRSVRLGVVLVQFAGAEGAPSSARAKPDALKHAVELAEQAKANWKAAVKAGDSGSSEDIGRIPRGVLDRATELAVFSLDKDALSEPLETPRGYWVVKRIE